MEDVGVAIIFWIDPAASFTFFLLSLLLFIAKGIMLYTAASSSAP